MTSAHTRVLVLASTPSHAELAARWVRGDAWVVIGAPSRDGSTPANEWFDGVTISGDLTDASWVSECFAVADEAIGAGGSVTVTLADDPCAPGDESVQAHALPGDVATGWRMVSTVVEHPWTAVEFVRATEADDTAASNDSFVDAQAASYSYRLPERDASLGNEEPASTSNDPTYPRGPLRRACRRLIRRGVGPLIRFVGRGTDSRGRRLAVRLDRRAPALARRVRRIANRIYVTVEPATQQAVRDIESRLLTMRVPVGAASVPPNLTVGIVVVAGDSARLAAWLPTLRRQRHQYWTCVVVDDASREDIAATVAPYRLADSRIRLARHGARRGVSASRNTGLRLLDTDLVLFVDLDGELPPAALADAVAGLGPFVRDTDVAGVRVGPETFDRTQRAEGAPSLTAGSVLVRRTVLDGVGWFDEALDPDQAWDDVVERMLRHGLRFKTVGSETVSRTLAAQATKSPRSVVGPVMVGAAAVAEEIGFDVGRTGSLERADRSIATERIVVWDRGEATWDDVAESARLGVRRALADAGASGARSLLIEDKIWRLGEVIAEEVLGPLDRAPAIGDASELDSSGREVDLLLIAESIADVGPLTEVAAAADPEVRVAAVDVELVGGDAGANEAWRRAGIPMVSYHRVVTSRSLPGAVIACAPVGPTVRDLLSAARAAGSTCRLLHVAGRPGTLPCSAGAEFDELVIPRDDVDRVVSSLRPDDGGERQPRRWWRGTDFSAVMHAEDGPLDAASIDRIAALRDRHLGETAVIIGNGPSLNQTDLSLLTDVPTFGVNSIFLAADRFPKPITYYVVEDTSVFNENVDAIKAFATEWKFFPAMYRPAFDDREVDERTVFFRMNAGFYDRKTGTFCHPRFSLDATQRLFCGQSVTTINLQLAHWMGFRRIVLIGMDFSYTIPEDVDRDGALIISRSDDPNHFHPDYFGAGKSWKDPLLDRVLVNYHLADEVYRATGREIVNATVGGQLNVFPRLSLRDALDGVPADAGSGER